MMSYTDETEISQAAGAEAQPTGDRPSGPRDGREGDRDAFRLDLDDGDIEADLFFGRD
jgi:hypothetical protein